jgi:hypothetical protein
MKKDSFDDMSSNPNVAKVEDAADPRRPRVQL